MCAHIRGKYATVSPLRSLISVQPPPAFASNPRNPGLAEVEHTLDRVRALLKVPANDRKAAATGSNTRRRTAAARISGISGNAFTSFAQEPASCL